MEGPSSDTSSRLGDSERLRIRSVPDQSAVMYQKWRSLLFLHFASDPIEIMPLLPPGLEVDTFPDPSGEPKAWVGLVPFRMEGVRPRFLPPLPGLSSFPEFNLRTYVHRRGRDPGVWFFSLEAANRIACAVARRFFGLPYHEAEMSLEEESELRKYHSKRLRGGADVEIEAELGPELPSAAPGTLEFFLVERYLLYSLKGGKLFTGRVHHAPYPLREAHVLNLRESLCEANGVIPHRYIHAIASDGVDVMVYGLCAIED